MEQKIRPLLSVQLHSSCLFLLNGENIKNQVRLLPVPIKISHIYQLYKLHTYINVINESFQALFYHINKWTKCLRTNYLAWITSIWEQYLRTVLESAYISEQCIRVVLGTISSGANWQVPKEHHSTWRTS